MQYNMGTKSIRGLLLALSTLAIFLPRLSVAAPLVITATDFNLTYPDGWTSYTASIDSAYSTLSLANGATVFGIGHHISSESEVAVYSGIFAQGKLNGYERVDSTNQTLGKYVFTIGTYKFTSASARDSANHLKVYITHKNNYLFISYMIYVPATSVKAIADQDSAMASLTITASTSIRSVKQNIFSKSSQTNSKNIFDLRGKSWEHKNARAPLFSLGVVE